MKTHSIRLRKTSVFLALMLALTFYSSPSDAQIRIGASIDVPTYVPPSWAPPYDNVSSVRYYYLPDYDMYYDVWDGQFWYAGPDGAWIYSEGLPPQYAGIDLSDAFMVLIDRNISRPWRNEGYYRANYPSHGYDNYRDIVVRNRIVTNTAPGHELVPRAFNENSNRVTFMQRPVQNGAAAHASANYHRVAHEVPMKSIAPSMPKASKNLNYGRGYTRPAGGAPKGAPNGGAPPKGGGGSRGGGAPKGGGGKR